MWDSLSLLGAKQHNYLCPFSTEDKDTVVSCGVELVNFYISISFDIGGKSYCLRDHLSSLNCSDSIDLCKLRTCKTSQHRVQPSTALHWAGIVLRYDDCYVCVPPPPPPPPPTSPRHVLTLTPIFTFRFYSTIT